MSFGVSIFGGRLPDFSLTQVQLVKEKQEVLLLKINLLPSSTPLAVKSWLRCRVWCVIHTDIEASRQLDDVNDAINKFSAASK